MDKTREINVPVWRMTASEYQSRIGVHQPWIFEISPSQFAAMSKRQQKEYEQKRAREWQASADAKREWRELVVQAYERGEFTLQTTGLSDEAKFVVLDYLREKAEQHIAEYRDRAVKANEIRNIENVSVGDIIYVIIICGYAKVMKVNRKSIVVLTQQGLLKLEISQRGAAQALVLSPDDLEKAIAHDIEQIRKHYAQFFK